MTLPSVQCLDNMAGAQTAPPPHGPAHVCDVGYGTGTGTVSRNGMCTLSALCN